MIMKTLHTIYTSFAKRLAIILTLLLTLGVTSAWGETYEYDFSQTTVWYTTSSKTTNVSNAEDLSKFYDKNGVEWQVSSNPDRARFNSGYFILGKSGAYITLPTFSGEKITSVVITASGGHSTSVSVNIMTNSETAASTNQTWSTTGETHTYEISSSYQSSSLRIQVTNAYRTQFTKVTINTESVATAYNVTWNNDGHGTIPSTSPTSASSVTLPSLTATGYAHSGWKANVDVKNTSTGATISANTLISNGTTVTLTQATTFTAQWTPKQVTITWNANGGIVTPSTSNYIYDGSSVTLPTPTRDGYNFKGWYTSASGGTQITDIGTNNKPASDVTYYAQWKEKQLTNYRTSCTTETIVTLDPNGGTISNTDGWTENGNGTYSKTHEGTEIALPTATKTNYIFGGWYNAETKYESIPSDLDESITLTAKWLDKQDAGIYWDPESVTVTIDADGNILPEFNNPNEIDGIEFSSSNPSVVAVDANGVITLGSTGATATVTITATFDGDETYAAKTVTCSITVHPSNCKWVETNIIEHGDEVVITMTGTNGITYTFENTKNTNSAPDAVKVDYISGTYITSVVDGVKWVVNKDGDDLTFKSYSSNDYLYCINQNGDGVRVGNTSSSRIFIIDNESGYLKHKETSRYLGVYSYQDWRCYANKDNFAGQTLKFYKKVCLDSETFWVDYNLANVTCTTAPPHSQIAKSETLTLNFASADGYALPDNVTVTNASKTWDKSTGTLTISNPTANVTITIEALKLHTVTWMVGSNSILTEKVANATGVTQTPDNPANDAIGECANAFMGWTETSLGSAEGQSAPSDLCSAAQMKAKHTSVTGDKTFYAVFATKSSGGGAEIGTVVFSEDFSSFTSGTKMTGTQSSGTGRSIYGDVSVTYSYQNGTSADTKIYGENNAGGTSPELLVGKNSSTFTISGIPSAGAAKLQLSYKQNAKSLTSKVSGTGYSGGMQSSTKQTTTTIITVGSVSTFNLTFTGPSGSDNARLDDICITVEETSVSYSNYVTNCCALAPATNLTVSGTTANSATLTWTAPSSTTGITKLQVRNAETDEVVVNNIAVNTTTATITGLTECTSYQYYVVSVGEDCEVVSNIVTAQPFGNAKTVNYNYNGGSGSVASFTTSCTNQTITLPAATRTGYDFNGWYTAVTGGTCVGGANDTYEPATSPVTLHAQWTIKSYTVTWNPNGGNWGGSTANIVETYEYGAIIDTPEDPKRENGIFKGWNPSVPSNMPAGNQTYTAQWEMVYTLTFVDMNAGGTTSTLTQTSSGQNIVAPTANSEVCDMWTFIGWAPSNSLNGGTDKPTGFIAAGETILGSQITGNNTYYSVYSYNSDNTQEFEVGKSGTYFMYAISGTTKYYATTVKTSNTAFYANTESDMSTYSSKKSTFILTYNTNTTKYVIKHINTTADKESEGYFYQADPTKKDITVNSSSSSSFEIAKGETQGSYRIKFTYTANSNTVTGNFGQSSSSFQGYAEGYDIFFEPASEIQYYNAADCGEVETYTMSFHNPFGDENALIWYDAEHEESYYTDKPLNTSIDVFPTMVYNGWTFIGWTPNQQYNDLIGEENLDEENSATNDPADLVSTIYSNEAGWAYKLTSNVTMYPVFTKFEDNEPFDMVNGGDYYIYYIADADITASVDKYGAVNRIYAGAWESGGTSDSYGATQSCTNATLFTFTKLSNGKWTIYDNTNRKYLCAGATDNNLALNATAATNGEWTITVHNGNQVNAVSKEGYTLSALSQDAVTGTFKNYATSNFNNNSAYYHRVYVGTCTERVYSSNPSNKPIIQLSGDVYVTATNARGVMATSTLKVSARKLNANEQVNITSNSNDVYFSADRTVNFVKANKPTNTLTITASPSGVIEQDIYVHYKPSAEGNGTPASVVVSANLATPNPSVTDDQTIHVRNLPAKFVIATKVGATWYALPADMSSATNPLGVVIEVDEASMTAIAPNTASYTLFPVKTTNGEYDRYATNTTHYEGNAYGDRVRFAAVNNNNGLWANNNENGNTIRNYAAISSVSDGGTTSNTNPSYEWKITTTVVDGNWQYTLQTDQDKNQQYLRYWVGATGAPKWGTYAAGNNQLYFLPVTETEPFDYKVVEWSPTKMLIQTDATIANPTAKIGDAPINNVTCTNKGDKLYEIAGLPLESNPTKVLTIKFSNSGNNYTNATAIPVIISRSTTNMSGEPFVTLTKDVYNYADLVVRDGATLTIDGGTHAENTFFNVTIYPTSKISVPDGKKLTVHSLTFFGGIDEIYNGSTYDLYKYGVPELSLKGTLYKSIAKMDYVMRVDLDQMYSLTVPYDVQLADIKYWDGSDIALGSALYVSAYDGEARANQSKKTWIYETDFNPATLKAGVGYTISAELQASVGNEYSILRMPMVSNVENDDTETAKTVAVTAHGIDANITDNHKGWNLVGNPYMTTIQGADDADLVLGYLQETGTGPWEWVEKTYRYVTIPSDDGTYYWQQKFTTAELPPFKNFFVQIGTTGELQFGLGTRQSMPARSTQAAIEKEVEFEILMSNDARQDNTGLLISEEYSPAYEINADLEKMTGSMSVYTIFGGYKLAYNALSPINASEWIPMGYIAPAAGEYTFRLDDVEKIVEQVEHVYIIDYNANNIVDLMDEEYKFTTDKEQNDNRFAINVVLIQDKDNTTTGLDIINGNNTAPIKFIYHDKIYIKSGEVIYDGTGKQVTNINK